MINLENGNLPNPLFTFDNIEPAEAVELQRSNELMERNCEEGHKMAYNLTKKIEASEDINEIQEIIEKDIPPLERLYSDIEHLTPHNTTIVKQMRKLHIRIRETQIKACQQIRKLRKKQIEELKANLPVNETDTIQIVQQHKLHTLTHPIIRCIIGCVCSIALRSYESNGLQLRQKCAAFIASLITEEMQLPDEVRDLPADFHKAIIATKNKF
uniref:Uncharacterized protein n=1 Tax=Panagrolaimus davidi TaxID=227884 RepID=A0A914QDS9_9BILA